jgi:ketosteroid isomerase-like protein
MIMRNVLAYFFASVAAVGLVACGGAAPAQEFGKADAEQITQLVRDFVTAYNARDVQKIGTFFTASASVMPANRSTMNGVEAVKAFYTERFTIDGATDLAIETVSVQGHGPLAYFAGTFRLNLRPATGPARHDRGKVIWIVRKIGGQWRFEYQIMSSDLPPVVPVEAAPADKK